MDSGRQETLFNATINTRAGLHSWEQSRAGWTTRHRWITGGEQEDKDKQEEGRTGPNRNLKTWQSVTKYRPGLELSDESRQFSRFFQWSGEVDDRMSGWQDETVTPILLCSKCVLSLLLFVCSKKCFPSNGEIEQFFSSACVAMHLIHR